MCFPARTRHGHNYPVLAFSLATIAAMRTCTANTTEGCTKISLVDRCTRCRRDLTVAQEAFKDKEEARVVAAGEAARLQDKLAAASADLLKRQVRSTQRDLFIAREI